MLNFQVACGKKIRPNNNSFCTASKCAMALLICKLNALLNA